MSPGLWQGWRGLGASAGSEPEGEKGKEAGCGNHRLDLSEAREAREASSAPLTTCRPAFVAAPRRRCGLAAHGR